MSGNHGLVNDAAAANNMTDLEIGPLTSQAGVDQNVEAEAKSAHVVDWAGPDDAANPRNWSYRHKMVNILLVSLSVFYVNLATTMFAPGASVMQREFGYRSDNVEILTISIATLGSAVGQLLIPPLSEVFGRRPVYQGSAVFYLGFTVGCACSTRVAEFLVFRMLTGVAASSYMSTGGATIADLLPREERAVAMALYSSGPLLGPVLGPIVGGFVTEHLGWRWTFYLILILASSITLSHAWYWWPGQPITPLHSASVVTLASFFFTRETSAAIILKKKAARLRRETRNAKLLAAGDQQIPAGKLLRAALTRPTRILFLSPVVVLMSLLVAVNFGVIILLFSTFPAVFEAEYHWRVSYTGLAYCGVAVGCALGVAIFARLGDKLLVRKGPDGRPEERLILMMWTAPLLPGGLLVYGWTTRYGVHWVVPIVGTSICGLGLVTVGSCAQAYMVDIFGPDAAASATGAMSLLRNLAAAFLPLSAPSLYAAVGLGWGNSVLALIAALFIPLSFIFYRHGELLRNRFGVKI
ncbi:MFS transporter [Cordyceps javanica]|uniref:MFS transporter n=1 Tax=Cordyceps javanica TaxID=43265 RepID=A0A545UR17_9HYPO|nr:MFS transporter [Cordyceps javanica]TQW03845.1 MFS transporter [Cordyceps javanica]